MDAAGYKISTSHLSIIADLWIKNGLSQSELGSALVKGKSTINTMIKHLVNEGFVQVEKHPTDRRAHKILLTKKGRDLCTFLEKIQLKIDKHLEAIQTIENIQTTKTTLSDLFNQLSADLKLH